MHTPWKLVIFPKTEKKTSDAKHVTENDQMTKEFFRVNASTSENFVFIINTMYLKKIIENFHLFDISLESIYTT